jgi:hypothetical protein
VCQATDDQTGPQVVFQPSSGPIIVWLDGRHGSNDVIYAQRLDGVGAPQWSLNGRAVSDTTNYAFAPQIIDDGANGAIIKWHRGAGWKNPWVQRIDSSGTGIWGEFGGPRVGFAMTSWLSSIYTESSIVSDGDHGVIVVWREHLNNFGPDYWGADVFSNGVTDTLPWGELRSSGKGEWVSARPGDQTVPVAVEDGLGGAIAAWEDDRNGNADIYAARFDHAGVLGPPPTDVPFAREEAILVLAALMMVSGILVLRFRRRAAG